MKINNTLLVLDTETGGVDPNNSSLMEIGCVVLKDFEIVHKYSSLVKSSTGKYLCNDFARKLHQISDEEIELNGKYPIEIIQDLKSIQETYFDNEPMTIIAHNAAFDISFVKKMFADSGKELSSMPSVDELSYDNIFSRNVIDTATMALVLRLQDKLPFDRCSLDNILKFYNVENSLEEKHTALYDAEQTAKGFVFMYNDLSGIENNIESADEDYEDDFDDSDELKK